MKVFAILCVVYAFLSYASCSSFGSLWNIRSIFDRFTSNPISLSLQLTTADTQPMSPIDSSSEHVRTPISTPKAEPVSARNFLLWTFLCGAFYCNAPEALQASNDGDEDYKFLLGFFNSASTKKGIYLEIPNFFRNVVLTMQYGDFEEAQNMLTSGPRSQTTYDIFYWCAEKGQPEMIKFLVENVRVFD